MSVPSIDSGNSTITDLTGKNRTVLQTTQFNITPTIKSTEFLTDFERDLVLGNIDLSDEEKEFLLKLTEEPTSVSADLAPPKTSFITPGIPQVPSTVSPITPNDLVPQSTKRLLKLPTTLGLGFDPTAIEPGNECTMAKLMNLEISI